MFANAPLAGGGLLLGPQFFIIDYGYITMLTIEDGSIVSVANGSPTDADSYVDIAFVTTYATRYGATWDTGDPLANEQAILRAMLYVESFEYSFCGYRVSDLQVLSWPREGVINARGSAYLPSNAIETGLKNAVAEAAIIEMSSPGTLLTPSLTSTQVVKRLKQKVDVLEKEVEYFEGAETIKSHRFERLRTWLMPYICFSGGYIPMARA